MLAENDQIQNHNILKNATQSNIANLPSDSSYLAIFLVMAANTDCYSNWGLVITVTFTE